MARTSSASPAEAGATRRSNSLLLPECWITLIAWHTPHNQRYPSSPTLTHGPGSAPRHRPPLSPVVAGAAGHENWGDAGCREGQESPTAAKGFLGSRENGFHGIQRNSSDKTPACLFQPRFLLISLVPGVDGFTVKLRCPPGLPQRGFC